MAHGYIGDGYGIDGGVNSDRDEDRDRDTHWRDRDRDGGKMFGGRDREWSEDGGWSDRGWRGEQGTRGEGDWEQRRSFSAHPDDHYRSWRDRHMSEIDRDYEDYCREREEAFHHEFNAWRQQRHANYQPLRTGMTNSGLSHDPSGETQVATEGKLSETDPMGAATLGTNSSEETRTGRGRR